MVTVISRDIAQVALLLKLHAPEIADKRRAMRRRLPFPSAVHDTWALDLSFYASPQGTFYTVLGIIDHGSRRLLCLTHLPRKCTLALLGHLFLAMARFGTPKVVRTDNESMFTSRLWQAILKFLGIDHRRSAVGCPWQNGRIEHLFGTLKPLLKSCVPRQRRV